MNLDVDVDVWLSSEYASGTLEKRFAPLQKLRCAFRPNIILCFHSAKFPSTLLYVGLSNNFVFFKLWLCNNVFSTPPYIALMFCSSPHCAVFRLSTMVLLLIFVKQYFVALPCHTQPTFAPYSDKWKSIVLYSALSLEFIILHTLVIMPLFSTHFTHIPNFQT